MENRLKSKALGGFAVVLNIAGNPYIDGAEAYLSDFLLAIFFRKKQICNLKALHNHSTQDIVVENEERVAQMVIAPYLYAVYEEVNELDETVRGEGGFGSTGK